MAEITIRIPDEKLAAFEAIAEREARPKDDVILEALDQYLAQRERKLPDWIGSIDIEDETVTARNVKDWIRANWRPE
jgi:predicted transcriptional regulator